MFPIEFVLSIKMITCQLFHCSRAVSVELARKVLKIVKHCYNLAPKDDLGKTDYAIRNGVHLRHLFQNCSIPKLLQHINTYCFSG